MKDTRYRDCTLRSVGGEDGGAAMKPINCGLSRLPRAYRPDSAPLGRGWLVFFGIVAVIAVLAALIIGFSEPVDTGDSVRESAAIEYAEMQRGGE